MKFISRTASILFSVITLLISTSLAQDPPEIVKPPEPNPISEVTGPLLLGPGRGLFEVIRIRFDEIGQDTATEMGSWELFSPDAPIETGSEKPLDRLTRLFERMNEFEETPPRPPLERIDASRLRSRAYESVSTALTQEIEPHPEVKPTEPNRPKEPGHDHPEGGNHPNTTIGLDGQPNTPATEEPWYGKKKRTPKKIESIPDGSVHLHLEGHSPVESHENWSLPVIDFGELNQRRLRAALELHTTLKNYSSAEMQLFAISKSYNFFESGSSYQLEFADSSVMLTEQELAVVKSGQPLPESHELSRLVQQWGDTRLLAYSGSPLSPNIIVNFEQEELDNFAFGLAKAYRRPMFTDPLSDKTPEQVRRLNALGKSIGAKTIAVVADDSFEVRDYKIIQNLEDELRTNGVDVISVSDNGTDGAIDWSEPSGSLVLVITGHIDEKLATFVRRLGEAGVFRDNYIIFNTCRTRLSKELASEMVTSYSAIGVHRFDRAVTPEEIERVLPRLPGRIRKNSEQPFLDIWRNNLEEHQLNGVWTICKTWRRVLGEPA